MEAYCEAQNLRNREMISEVCAEIEDRLKNWSWGTLVNVFVDQNGVKLLGHNGILSFNPEYQLCRSVDPNYDPAGTMRPETVEYLRNLCAFNPPAISMLRIFLLQGLFNVG